MRATSISSVEGVVQSDRPALEWLISGELEFHAEPGHEASHGLHSFPAKFPPQLPRKFILGLTKPGEFVLDPMCGSGTTPVEAREHARRAVAFDIDPLAVLISKVKTTPIDEEAALATGLRVLASAKVSTVREPGTLLRLLGERFGPSEREFLDYWFASQVQLELVALVTKIEEVPDYDIRRFLTLTLSATIITKSGGVSLALDLAHTRPHRAKVVYDYSGQPLEGFSDFGDAVRRQAYVSKRLRSPFQEFEKRLRANVQALGQLSSVPYKALVANANAESLPLHDSSIDLIVTSPPYAANAIDYMRAHKFSLVWLERSLAELTGLRSTYIGSEATYGLEMEQTPKFCQQTVERVRERDERRGAVLQRYLSEMTRVLRESYRVLKPGRCALFVVGSSTMRGVDTNTHRCLAEIGQSVGFEEALIATRQLDRDRRMMPATRRGASRSQIEQRMHEEHIIALVKPTQERDAMT